MSRRFSSLKWAVFFLATATAFVFAGSTPRNPNVRAESWVQIGDAGLQVKQVQTFQQQAATDLWNKLDANGDGRLSSEEKKSAEQILRPLFTGHSTLKLNWQIIDPSTVAVTIDSLSQRRGKNNSKQPLLSVTFFARYPVLASKADLVELLPDLDAHECAVHFTWDAGYIPLRTSMGQQGKGNVWDMNQIDGVPPAFSVVIHKQPSGVDSIPSVP